MREDKTDCISCFARICWNAPLKALREVLNLFGILRENGWYKFIKANVGFRIRINLTE